MKKQIYSISIFLLLLQNIALFAQAETVKIGSNYWSTKNLNVAIFNNGDLIPEAKTVEEWRKAGRNKQPAWCYFDNNPENGEKHGKLYNWYAVNDPRGIAPDGWHVPSYNEWQTINSEFGNDAALTLKSNTGWSDWETGGARKAKCNNCIDWSEEYRYKVACNVCKDSRSVTINDPIIKHPGNGKNSIGFNAKTAGFRYGNNNSNFGTFTGEGYSCSWWTSDISLDENQNQEAKFINLSYDSFQLMSNKLDKMWGISVRLIKNDERLNKIVQEKKQRTKDSLQANQNLQNFNNSLAELTKIIEDGKIEEAKSRLLNLKSKYNDIEVYGAFKLSGLHADIKKLEDKLNQSLKPLSEDENVLIGTWQMEGKLKGDEDLIEMIIETQFNREARGFICDVKSDYFFNKQKTATQTNKIKGQFEIIGKELFLYINSNLVITSTFKIETQKIISDLLSKSFSKTEIDELKPNKLILINKTQKVVLKGKK